jgi:hypothetical protein
MEGKHEASDEMIVGELDEAIGGGANLDASKSKEGGHFSGEGKSSMFDDEAAAAPNSTFSYAGY